MIKITLYCLTFIDMLFKIFWWCEIASSLNICIVGVILSVLCLGFEWAFIRDLREKRK